MSDLPCVSLLVIDAVGSLATQSVEGTRLHQIIVEFLNQGFSVELDFAGVKIVTPAFYEAVVGDLDVTFPEPRLKTVNLPNENSVF
jgi:hypothetical protein